MKVLLLKDVVKIGKKGDVRDVNQGHAMNFLIPRKFARAVSDAEIKNLAFSNMQEKEKELIEKDLAIKNLMSLKGREVILKEKANEKGHLFSKVHVEEILKAVQDQCNIKLPKDSLIMKEAIKEIGETNLTVNLFDIKVDFILKIESIK